MKTENLKVGDFAVNVGEEQDWLTIGKKYPIVALSSIDFVILDNDGDVTVREIDDPCWSLEQSPLDSSTITKIVEVHTKVVVTFEKTEIEHGEEFLIKTIELADMPDLRKEVEYQICNLANPEADVVNVKWEK
jgi:hypothetical protein